MALKNLEQKSESDKNSESGENDVDNVNEESKATKSKFHYATAVKLVPHFDEKNIENFLITFEKTMAIHKFPEDKWASLLSTKLAGKASQVFAELSLEECQDYEVLKQAVLVAYAKVPKHYRQRFRNMIKGD